MKHIVSYGGGVNSTAMVIWLLQHEQPIDRIIFCDTGAELPETLEYVNTFGAWLKQYGLTIETIGREEGLYEYCTRLKIIPFRQFRWCTSRFKIEPFDEIVNPLMPVTVYIGFDAGEESRVLNAETPVFGRKCKPKTSLYGKKYPLFQNRIDRAGCMELIRNAGLPDPPKSGCFICPFMSPKQYQHMKNERPELFKKALDLELNCARGSRILESVSLTDIYNQQEMELCSYDIELPCGCFDGS